MNGSEQSSKRGRRVFIIWSAILLLIPTAIFFRERSPRILPDKPADFAPLGTNALGLGTMLYEPHGTQFFGTVLQADAEYEFPNGDIEPAVLVKDRHRTEAWVKRTNLNKALVAATQQARTRQ